ncbi:acyl carrier protein [Fictibacillus enclensis]|uniref:acyl carrier protein n=1 Tax=Fictibacillus enclensis TaxID=1017270 RepID=UPI0025A1F6DD|nr:acyl carrier protein [Fictibacillus enclensis]MDM5335831.1 acyl carrier protein [Fictibacillus enclensis]
MNTGGINSMENSNLVKKVVSLIEEVSDVDLTEFDGFLHVSLVESGIDSLMALELGVHLERTYGIRLTEEDLTEMKNVQSIIELLKLKGIEDEA